MKNCKTCEMWKNKQRELDYSLEYGICEGLREYSDEPQIKIIPHEGLSIAVGYLHLNSDVTIKEFEYELCTYKTFGCNKWSKK